MTEPNEDTRKVVRLTDDQIALLLEAISGERVRADIDAENAKKEYDDATVLRRQEAVRDLTELEGELLIVTGEYADWDAVWGDVVTTGPHGDVLQFDPDDADAWSPEEERLTWSIVMDGWRLRAIPGYAKHNHVLYYVTCRKAWTDADAERSWIY